MNLAVLKKSRPVLLPGDFFAMLPQDRQFLFGRVIHTNANPLGVGGGILIYVYRVRSATKERIPKLSPDQLLLPPLITNRRPWTMGYFENVRHDLLRAEDCLPQHAFRDSRGWLFDEVGNRLDSASDPIGEWGLHSFQTIDDDISRALATTQA